MITVVIKQRNGTLKGFEFSNIYEAEQAGFNITNEREFLNCGYNRKRYYKQYGKSF